MAESKSNKLWRVHASEVDGERARLIEFLVRAKNKEQAEEIGWDTLRNEWPGGMPEEMDGTLEFFDGEITIEQMVVEPTTPAAAVRHFTRAR